MGYYYKDVILAGNNNILVGVATGTAGTAVNLPDNACHEVLVQNTGTATLSIGNSTSQPILLGTGASIDMPINNTNLIWYQGATTLSWFAVGEVYIP